MADNASPAGGTPGAPAINPAPPPPEFNFVRERATQMAQQQQQPAPGAQPAAEPDARQPQQQPQPAEQKIKIGDAEYDVADVHAAMAERAEAAVRKTGLPSAPEGYEARNSPDFKLPEGISYQFDQADPALAAARRFALANNLTQQQFSGMLDLFVSTQVGGLMDQQQMRQKNLDALGAAGVQRIAAIGTFLKSIAGKDGAEVAAFIQNWPAAPFVRSLEAVIKRFSSQGGTDYSGQHRETTTQDSGKIPGYENMSFAERRVAQMAQMMNRPGYRGGGSRKE
jgi:hypothetical protein